MGVDRWTEMALFVQVAETGSLGRAASPGYLGRCGTPRTVDDLTRHAMLVYTYANNPLVPVLDAWDLPRLTINLAYRSRKHLPAKVRTFIDLIAEHFGRMEYDRKWTMRFGY